jgi:5-hydroxyisourate hydrolase-like protein (transthyretin family)
VGTYEWTFYAGDYFAGAVLPLSGTPFLDVIPLR